MGGMACPLPAPGDRGKAAGKTQVHQPVIGRVELHLVDPVAKAVEIVEHRQHPVRFRAPVLHFGAADPRAELGEAGGMIARLGGAHRIGQRAIAGEQVDVLQRRRLVEHLVGILLGERFGMGHGASSSFAGQPSLAARRLLCLVATTRGEGHAASNGKAGGRQARAVRRAPRMTPAARPTLLSRLVKRILLALYRWKAWELVQVNPVPPRCVILGAPHTSNWDFVFFLGATNQLGIEPNFMGKHSLFRWPMTRFMFDMGGIAVDRSARDRNYVEQVVGEYARRERLALVIAPEGTRGAISGWKSGFYHIAHGAGVPIVPAWVDNATMRGGVGPAIATTGDYAADLRKIAEFYFSVLPGHPKLGVLYKAVGLIPADTPEKSHG